MDGVATNRLLGIARHARSRGAIEALETASVSVPLGIHGDFRGAVKPGGKGRRQVTVMHRAAWAAAMAELGRDDIDWSARRANLLVDGDALPQVEGALLHFAGGVVLRVTGECDPCSRMEEIAPGLRGVLIPDWRGGVTTKVIADGSLAVGDDMRIIMP
jgi:MOSC domain-containing protein YiiM